MIRFFKQYIPTQEVILFAGESLLIMLGFLLSAYTYFHESTYFLTILPILFSKALLVTMVCQLVFYYNNFYKIHVMNNLLHLSLKLCQSFIYLYLILAFIYYIITPSLMIDLTNSLKTLFVITLLISVWRILFQRIVRTRKLNHRILIIGIGNISVQLAEEFNKVECPMNIIGFIGDDPSKVGETILNPKIIGNFSDLWDIAKIYRPHSIVVALDDRRNALPLQEILSCRLNGISIENHISFLEKITGRLMVENLRPSDLVFSDGFKKSKCLMAARRVIEIIITLVFLILLFPILLVIAILILIDSGKPVFYQQERVGLNGKSFTIFKFRSMYNNSEKNTGPVWAQKNDSRITKIGKIIRQYRIDEIPQLWNVLKGDMSLVGPRAERPYFVEKFVKNIPYYDLRHSVKPGITGWAQIQYPYGSSGSDALEKLKYDLYFIKNLSFSFDLLILFKTLKVVLTGKGAR
jgi:sugar transferase (PEP-CTERM system associated)